MSATAVCPARVPTPYAHRKKSIQLYLVFSAHSLPASKQKWSTLDLCGSLFFPLTSYEKNHNDWVPALTRSQQCQLWTSFNRQTGYSKVLAPTNLRCMSSWQQNNYFLRGSYCLQHAMNSVQVQCQFITLHYSRQLTSWVQLLKKREIISALVRLDSPPPWGPNKCSEGKKL